MTQTRSNRTFKTAPMMRITRGARAQGAKTPEEKTEKLERTKKVISNYKYRLLCTKYDIT